MRNIVLFGPPGCGKGTQAAILANNLGYIKVSTGDLLRDIAEEDSDLGIKIHSVLSSGLLVSDEEVNQLVEHFYSRNKNATGLIFDGYPRNVSQVKALELILSKHKDVVSNVFYFDLSEDTLVKRITGRYACNKCGTIYNSFFFNPKKIGECDNCCSSSFNKRADDSKDTLLERLKVYKNSTAPLLEYYKDKLIKIDAEALVDTVSESIMSYFK